MKAISSEGVCSLCAKLLPTPCSTPKNQVRTEVLPVLPTTVPLLKGLSSLNVQQEHFIHARSGGVAGISALCSTFGHCCLGGYGIFSANVLIDVYNTVLNYFTTVHKSLTYSLGQGIRNEGIYQRNVKIWGNVADKVCFGCT